MRTRICTPAEVLSAYAEVSSLYGFVPPLSHWRAWELAAYRHYRLEGRVLDLGCGDGRYFRLVWPEAADVVGVDADAEVARLGRESGVYQAVHNTFAHQVPEADGAFDSAFANCSLEHMDHLPAVLREIQRCLKPGGVLLCSVVTDRFLQWSMLPKFVRLAGGVPAGDLLERQFLEFHHLMNPLPVQHWKAQFEQAELVVQEHVPILPLFNSGFFLGMDTLWHVKKAGGGEFGDMIHPFLTAHDRFPKGFAQVLAGLMEMESDWEDCSGAVFLVRKPGGMQ